MAKKKKILIKQPKYGVDQKFWVVVQKETWVNKECGLCCGSGDIWVQKPRGLVKTMCPECKGSGEGTTDFENSTMHWEVDEVTVFHVKAQVTRDQVTRKLSHYSEYHVINSDGVHICQTFSECHHKDELVRNVYGSKKSAQAAAKILNSTCR